ncbi:MAG: purine-nucleoside phosphorylase [Opitutales bacterium]
MSLDADALSQAQQHLAAKWPGAHPTAALVCGSGWNDLADIFSIREVMPYAEIPGLGATGVEGHAGQLSWAELNGIETFLFQGRRHFYEGVGWTPIAIPIHLAKSFGVSSVLLTNAAGGIRDSFATGDLMILRDHLNFMPGNPLIGPHDSSWGPRFPDQSKVYHTKLRALLQEAAEECGSPVSEGVYLALSGPTFETPAEIEAFRTLGADAVGMSTVPEAILANAAGLRVAALSCISNLAAGVSPHPLSHEEVAETAAEAMPRMQGVIEAFWPKLAES